jgi:hypothetical protein
MEEKKAQSYSDIWSISNDVLDKNEQVKKETFDIPDEDLVADNVHGFVINNVGNIVARFGFFVETENTDRIDLKISPDGFMASVYNKPTNIILGYGHPLRFSGLVDPKQSQILHLGPDKANGDNIIISVQNDDKLKEQGIICIMRDIDVMTDILPQEVKEDFEESLVEAAEPVADLNEIEASYNSYMKHIYVVLGENFGKQDTVVEKEESYE